MVVVEAEQDIGKEQVSQSGVGEILLGGRSGFGGEIDAVSEVGGFVHAGFESTRLR